MSTTLYPDHDQGSDEALDSISSIEYGLDRVDEKINILFLNFYSR